MTKNSFLSTLTILSLLVGFAFSTTSCKKYEEGPGLSLKSKKARLVNTWKLDELYMDGQKADLDEEDKTMRLIFEKDGKFTHKEGNDIVMTGTWDFDNDKEDIKITSSVQGFSVSLNYQIIKLKSNELGIIMSLPDEETGEISKLKIYLIPA